MIALFRRGLCWMGLWHDNAVMPKGYISTTEAAERTGKTRWAIIALIKRGTLPAEKFAGVWMIREKDLELLPKRKAGRPKTRLTK